VFFFFFYIVYTALAKIKPEDCIFLKLVNFITERFQYDVISDFFSSYEEKFKNVKNRIKEI
jgi:hypothetical protein